MAFDTGATLSIGFSLHDAFALTCSMQLPALACLSHTCYVPGTRLQSREKLDDNLIRLSGFWSLPARGWVLPDVRDGEGGEVGS